MNSWLEVQSFVSYFRFHRRCHGWTQEVNNSLHLYFSFTKTSNRTTAGGKDTIAEQLFYQSTNSCASSSRL